MIHFSSVFKLTEPVAGHFERCEDPPYYMVVEKDLSSPVANDVDDNKTEPKNDEDLKKDYIDSKIEEQRERIPKIISGYNCSLVERGSDIIFSNHSLYLKV